MVDSSWKWAASRNLVRKNRVHGEEEAKLVLAETFGSNTENGDMMTWSGEAECEDMGKTWMDMLKYAYQIKQKCGYVHFSFWGVPSNLQDPDGALLGSHLIPEEDFPCQPDAHAVDSEQAVKDAAAAEIAASAGSGKGHLVSHIYSSL